MNETDISNRASNLRRQAICRLNGIDCNESPPPEPRSSRADYELKNDSWGRPSSDYRTLIPAVAACLVIFNSYSLYVSEAQRDYLLAATNSRCISDVTIQRIRSKHPALYFNDAQGQKVASCFKFQCLYRNSHADVGKTAKICLSGDVVTSIETDGEQKVTRDSLIYVLANSIWWSKFWLGLGGICLAVFAFRGREKWKELIRSRFTST